MWQPIIVWLSSETSLSTAHNFNEQHTHNFARCAHKYTLALDSRVACNARLNDRLRLKMFMAAVLNYNSESTNSYLDFNYKGANDKYYTHKEWQMIFNCKMSKMKHSKHRIKTFRPLTKWKWPFWKMRKPNSITFSECSTANRIQNTKYFWIFCRKFFAELPFSVSNFWPVILLITYILKAINIFTLILLNDSLIILFASGRDWRSLDRILDQLLFRSGNNKNETITIYKFRCRHLQSNG